MRNVGAGDFVDVGLRNAIDAGVVPGPRMQVAASSLGARGGHCDDTGFPYLLFGRETGHRRRASPPGPTSSATRCASRSSTART